MQPWQKEGSAAEQVPDAGDTTEAGEAAVSRQAWRVYVTGDSIPASLSLGSFLPGSASKPRAVANTTAQAWGPWTAAGPQGQQ